MSLFTEVAALRPEPCDRLDCRKIIQPGELRFTIADRAGNSKLVCSDCNDHYKEKAKKLALENASKTAMKNIMTDTRFSTAPRLDFQTMRQNVNEAQRKGGSAPGGRVTALPAPKVSEGNFTAITGYSSNHDQHAQQTSLWSSRAYRGVKAGQVGSIKINLYLYQPNFDAKGQPIAINGIREGIRVSSDISSCALSSRIRDVMQPHIVEYCRQVPVDVYKMVIRDASNGGWIELERFSNDSYFGDQFLKVNPRKKDGTLIFSPPAKPLTFGLVFEKDVWSKLESIWDAEIYGGHSEPSSVMSTLRSNADTLTIGHRSKRKAPSSRRAQRAQKVARNTRDSRSVAKRDYAISGSDSDGIEYVGRPETPQDILQAEQEGTNSEPDGVVGSEHEGEDQKSESTGESGEEEEESAEAEEGGRSSRTANARSTTSVSTQLRDRATSTSRRFISLDFEAIKRGFIEGGMNTESRGSAYDSDSFVYELINFVDLPQPTFVELMANPSKLREDMLGPEAEVYNAQLRYDSRPSSFLGTGSFKTTSPGRLTFTGDHFPTSGLGMLLRKTQNGNGRTMSVALKRPFRSKTGGGISRMTLNKEQVAVFDECKLLVWASSLLSAAYGFIDEFKSQQSSPPPFDILRFRFVHAGMAIAQKPVDAKSGTPTTSRAVYILEEVLPRSKTDFIKYLHNADATPDISPDSPNYYFAEFLMFIQHAQYMITEGVAYVSDFQGVGLTLTDPQILTTPHFGDNLFGDGNLGEAFERFHIEHRCNKYCEWFGLEEPAETWQKLQDTLKEQGTKSKSKKSSLRSKKA